MTKKRLEDSFSEEEDPSGARGRARAEFKLRKQRYPSVLPVKKPLKEILKYTPAQIKSHPHVNSLMKADLIIAKNAGYNINIDYFNKQDDTGKWNYYLKVFVDNGYFK